MERDGSKCVFSRAEACMCDAVHIIPESKGNVVFPSLFHVIVLLNLLQVHCYSSQRSSQIVQQSPCRT